MSKIKILGDAMVVTSAVKTEDIIKLKTFKPEALKLVDEETKDEIFALTVGRSASFTKYGAIFTSSNTEGFATMTIGIPTNLSKEEKLEYVKKAYGQALLKLNELEDQLEAQSEVLAIEMDSIETAVEIVE